MIHHKAYATKSCKMDYEAFDSHLLQETNLLEQWFLEKKFEEKETSIGSELEFFLLDKSFLPSPNNLAFIRSVNQPFLIPEVGAAHLEINSSHFNLHGDCLSALHQNIKHSWQQCLQKASAENYHLAMMGSLPTATDVHCKTQFMTDMPRYHAIEACMAEQRAGESIQINIEGHECLAIRPESLAINGLISSFQLHLQMGLSQSVRYYNIAQGIAGPLLALSANAPFLFGLHLVDETRIFSFDQAMTIPYFDRVKGFNCCLFGTNYLHDSFFELFDQNFQFFPRLLPEVFPDLPPELLFHVRRQNGVVYRWNRPVIGFNENAKPHLRIEYRGLSSGPTIIDMMANAAFFYGLLHYLAIQPTPFDSLLSFHAARKNFYNAARYGLTAQFLWFSNREVNALTLIEELLPLAYKGLKCLGISATDCEYYLSVIKKRIKKKTNGSQWQIKFIEKYGKDFFHLMENYLDNQYEGRPVSEWKI